VKDETIASQQLNINALTQTIAHLTAPAMPNKRSKPST